MDINSLGNEFFMWFLGILGTVITSFLLPALVSWLKAKTKNQNLQYIIDELSTTITASIDYTNQVYVEQLKKDGKFDLESQQEALNKAVNYVINNLTNTATKIIQKEGIDLVELIENKIEAQIAENKKLWGSNSCE